MRLPPQGSSAVCEAWVQLEEPEDHRLGSLIGGSIEMCWIFQAYVSPFSGTQKFCGLTVPNYPGPSVIMSGYLYPYQFSLFWIIHNITWLQVQIP